MNILSIDLSKKDKVAYIGFNDKGFLEFNIVNDIRGILLKNKYKKIKVTLDSINFIYKNNYFSNKHVSIKDQIENHIEINDNIKKDKCVLKYNIIHDIKDISEVLVSYQYILNDNLNKFKTELKRFGISDIEFYNIDEVYGNNILNKKYINTIILDKNFISFYHNKILISKEYNDYYTTQSIFKFYYYNLKKINSSYIDKIYIFDNMNYLAKDLYIDNKIDQININDLNFFENVMGENFISQIAKENISEYIGCNL